MKDKTILVVEDDPTLARFWGRLLSDLHCHHYHIASSPRDALDWMKENGSDILVADLNLPEISGLQLIQKARLLNKRMKAILTSTSYNANGSKPDGFIHFLKKPYQKLDKIYQFMGSFMKNDHHVRDAEKKGNMHIWDL